MIDITPQAPPDGAVPHERRTTDDLPIHVPVSPEVELQFRIADAVLDALKDEWHSDPEIGNLIWSASGLLSHVVQKRLDGAS